MLQHLRQLDAFPKFEPSAVRQTAIGGFISLVVYISILLLSLGQAFLYFTTRPRIEYSNFVDPQTTGQITLKIDMILANSCSRLQIMLNDQDMTRHFVLSEQSQQQQQPIPQSEDAFDALLHQFLAKMLDMQLGSEASCRIKGEVEIPRHSGTFKITPRSIQIAPGLYIVDGAGGSMNFSHTIMAFSFGRSSSFPQETTHNRATGDSSSSSLVSMYNGMESNEEVTVKPMQQFIYNVCIVPTRCHTGDVVYQHSINRYSRTPNFSMSSRPGIQVNWEFDPLSLAIKISRPPLRILLVKWLGIVAGLFACCHILHSWLTFV